MSLFASFLFLLHFFLVVTSSKVHPFEQLSINQDAVQHIVQTLGQELFRAGTEQTCLDTIRANYQAHSHEVSWFDGNKMMNEMRADVTNMLNGKRDAVERIAINSERLASNYDFDKNLTEVQYKNVKVPANDSEEYKRSANFDNLEVNLNQSAVHVPVNVYNKSRAILHNIEWSEGLTPIFMNNTKKDSSLSWQYFGSSNGFLRLYPSTPWKEPPNFTPGKIPPDFYDCRMRAWYNQGAASPKDIVILLDTSGSMTGMRKRIGQSVVANILDTLSDDDYVAALQFAKEVKPINPCFESTLVQATKRNTMEIKSSLDSVKTSDQANFTQALVRAFSLLPNDTQTGSKCNRAIMIITDGAPYTFEKIFKVHNNQRNPIRVFTYLIGKDSTSQSQVHWMACHNRGYYTHVLNLAEVREQVQKYIPVMSRPIVLSGERTFTWTPLSAPNSQLQLNEWTWRTKQNLEIIRRQMAGIENQNDEVVPRSDAFKDRDATLSLYTTLSTPVFDTRNYTNITKRILIKNVYRNLENVTVRIANLLGVAGIDVPIREIIKLTPAFKLGVNGYAFIISNNGYLLYHPDLRPFFQEFLKPLHNSVDMSEVELADNSSDRGPRKWDFDIESIRNSMINRKAGGRNVTVNIHLDDMKRVVTRKNQYFFGAISGTPFSLAIALPKYGLHRLVTQVDLKRENYTNYLSGNQWRLHPEWDYCSSPIGQQVKVDNMSREERIVHILSNDSQSIRWRTTWPHVHDTISCDKDLLQSLLLDAKLTDISRDKCNTNPNFIDEQQKFGIVTTFLATRSGLTRFHNCRTEHEVDESLFYEKHKRTIEEVYYQRAVDFNVAQNDAFVYSVDFNAGAQHEGKSIPNFLVTATQALFVGDGKQSTPVAVVGIQYRYNVLHQFFLNTAAKFNVPCSHKDMDCYLVDNNGFVVLSSHRATDVGRFFGSIDGDIFREMVKQEVLRNVTMFDYQAICVDVKSPQASGPSTSTIAYSILHQGFQAVSHLASLLVAAYVSTLNGNWEMSYSVLGQESSSEQATAKQQDYNSNRTTTRSCDKEFELYEMVGFTDLMGTQEIACGPNGACSRKYVFQYVPHTNLMLVLIANNPNCACRKSSISIEPKEVIISRQDRCKLLRTEKTRRRPDTCLSHHDQEKDIHQCGGAASVASTLLMMLSMTIGAFLCW